MENTAENLLPYANKLCKNEAQRQKLDALFEFKKLYEIVKGAENREYQLDSANAAMVYFKTILRMSGTKSILQSHILTRRCG